MDAKLKDLALAVAFLGIAAGGMLFVNPTDTEVFAGP